MKSGSCVASLSCRGFIPGESSIVNTMSSFRLMPLEMSGSRRN